MFCAETLYKWVPTELRDQSFQRLFAELTPARVGRHSNYTRVSGCVLCKVAWLTLQTTIWRSPTFCIVVPYRHRRINTLHVSITPLICDTNVALSGRVNTLLLKCVSQKSASSLRTVKGRIITATTITYATISKDQVLSSSTARYTQELAESIDRKTPTCRSCLMSLETANRSHHYTSQHITTLHATHQSCIPN